MFITNLLREPNAIIDHSIYLSTFSNRHFSREQLRYRSELGFRFGAVFLSLQSLITRRLRRDYKAGVWKAGASFE